MSNAVLQLELYQAVLAVIEGKRADSGDESLGANIERLILDTQFQELEHEILEDPGAFEPWLIRRRPRRVAGRPRYNFLPDPYIFPPTPHPDLEAGGLRRKTRGNADAEALMDALDVGGPLLRSPALGSLPLAAAIAWAALELLIATMASQARNKYRRRIPIVAVRSRCPTSPPDRVCCMPGTQSGSRSILFP